MAMFYCFTCEVCDEQTYVHHIQELTQEKGGLRAGPLKIEIERGCFHVCIDDAIKPVIPRVVHEISQI